MKNINELLNNINNILKIKKPFFITKGSILKYKICKLLELKGYLNSVYWVKYKQQQNLIVGLKYQTLNIPSIKGFKVFNQKNKKNILKYTDILTYLKYPGLIIITTSKGIMSLSKAQNLKIGGKLICHIW